MKREGRIVRWEAARGFGFIRSAGVTADVFVHQRDFLDRALAPQVGMAVRFDEIHVGGKGPRAVAVHLAAATATMQARAPVPTRGPRTASPRVQGAGPAPSTVPGAVLILAYVAMLAWAVTHGRLPLVAAAVLGALSALTFAVYGADKQAARDARRRTPESTLHLLALIGGWPGAWCAQRLLRHKSRKASFLAVYRITVALNLAATLAWVLRSAWR